MLYFLIPLLLIILYKCKFHIKDFNLNYISIDQTKCINAIFVVIVFLSHVRTYINLENIWYNSYYIRFNTFIGQLMVTTFLFFSGFGIMESIKRKKETYINNIPKKRILKTFINFAIAIFLFMLSNLIINESFDLRTKLLAFTGWTAIGNSNWYIFDILILYLATFISFKVFSKNNLKGILATTVLSIIFIEILKSTKQPHWYNTILCYPAGMFFSYYKEKFEKLVCENNKTYLFILIILSILFEYIHKYFAINNLPAYELMSILFVLIILLICMKFEFKNKILIYLGNNIFWIYILQRIPMRLLNYYKINNYNIFLFITLSFISTLLLTECVKIIIKLSDKTYKKLKNLSSNKA